MASPCPFRLYRLWRPWGANFDCVGSRASTVFRGAASCSAEPLRRVFSSIRNLMLRVPHTPSPGPTMRLSKSCRSFAAANGSLPKGAALVETAAAPPPVQAPRPRTREPSSDLLFSRPASTSLVRSSRVSPPRPIRSWLPWKGLCSQQARNRVPLRI